MRINKIPQPPIIKYDRYEPQNNWLADIMFLIMLAGLIALCVWNIHQGNEINNLDKNIIKINNQLEAY